MTGTASQKAYVSCRIHDNLGYHYSGTHSYWHNVTTSYVQLWLPYSSGQVNLQTFINSHSVAGGKEVYIYCNRIHPAIRTGNINAWTVTLEVQSGAELQGLVKGRTATNYTTNHGLYVETDLKLINNGVIRGAGGYGGVGAKGANDTYTTSVANSETRGDNYPNNFWGIAHSCQDWIGWDGKHLRANSITGSSTIPGISGTFYQGSHIRTYSSGDSCVTWYQYYITRKWTTSTSHSRTGGSGGLGGGGAGYGKDPEWDGPWRYGKAGGGSSPSGGNSGYRGGSGGWWGNVGYQGGGSGGAGYAAAPAIRTGGHLVAGSKTGSVSGSVVT